MRRIRVFLDTNALVYAHGKNTLFHRDSASVLEEIYQGNITGCVSDQNLFELYRILTKPSAIKGFIFSVNDAYEIIKNNYLNGP